MVEKRKPISIDLRDLTEAKVKRALKNAGGARYTDPCIIGTLMKSADRSLLDTTDVVDDYNIGVLARARLVSFPAGQLRSATALQKALDSQNEARFIKLVKRWVQP